MTQPNAQARAAPGERTRNFVGQVHRFPLHRAPREQGGINPGKNFIEWQDHLRVVILQTGREDLGRRAADGGERHRHDAAGQLRKNFPERNG